MNLFIQLFQLITLRRKPQDVAYSPEAVLIVFSTYVATSYFQMFASKLPVNALSFAFAQAVVQAVLFFLILKIKGKDQRFIQMATAAFGVSSILQFVSLIFGSGPLAMLGVIASGWNIALLITILRETLECQTPAAILITIAYHFIIGIALFMFFPDFFAYIQQQMIQPA